MDSKPIETPTTDTYKQPWYAIRLFTLKQNEVKQMFDEQSLESFIPMQFDAVEDENGHVKHIFKPVVRNLIFVKKPENIKKFKLLLSDSVYKMSVIKKSRESQEYYEIPFKQMDEFMIMCSPEIELRKFITEEEAKLKTGAHVIVKYGPLKGLTGRLVRQSKKYYLLKEIPGIGVMIKVSRWCCRELED
jgi:transcription antitermination factor NusG